MHWESMAAVPIAHNPRHRQAENDRQVSLYTLTGLAGAVIWAPLSLVFLPGEIHSNRKKKKKGIISRYCIANRHGTKVSFSLKSMALGDILVWEIPKCIHLCIIRP